MRLSRRVILIAPSMLGKCSEDLKKHALELTLWVSCDLLNGYIRGQGPAVAQVKPSGSYENFQGWK